MRVKDYPPLNATSTYRHEWTTEYKDGPRPYEGAHWQYTGETGRYGCREIHVISGLVLCAACWDPKTADLFCQALSDDRKANTQ